jgi:hypothetical protein
MTDSLDLNIDAGTTFDSITLRYLKADRTPVNLTGFTANFQIRKDVDAATALITKTFTINLATAEIPIVLSDTETASLIGGRFVWGLELRSATRVIRLAQGNVLVSEEVVR